MKKFQETVNHLQQDIVMIRAQDMESIKTAAIDAAIMLSKKAKVKTMTQVEEQAAAGRARLQAAFR
eukprot:8267435-Pyramimonas_sp.AAC.1